MLRRIELTNFKAFERLTVSLRGDAFLVGPNNAGKSTVIGALRACAHMLRYASSKSPSLSEHDGSRSVIAYPFSGASSGLVTENLRHEFRDDETRIEVVFANGSALIAVWPPDVTTDDALDDDSEEGFETYYEYEPDLSGRGFFYLTKKDGGQPRRPVDVRSSFPSLGIVPLLTPIEHDEEFLTWDYLRRNLDTRRASRHFRNQAAQIDAIVRNAGVDPWQEYLDMVSEWLPEIRIRERRVSRGELDLFYEDVGSRVQKEVYWAGDGVQVWLQLLLHLLRVRGCDAVVLDEPDVYLHPDLQRRLVRLLDAQPGQFITATHSPEVLAEASGDQVVWVDKSRRRSVKAPSDELLGDLSRALGSQFNLRLARALRAKAALFVEGDDMRLVRHVAETLGATHVAREIGIAQVPLWGFSNWERVEPFNWLVNNLLGKSVEVMVVLDRDYRSADANKEILHRFAQLGIAAHIWTRTELENYLVVPSAIARLSGATEEWVWMHLMSVAESLRHTVEANMLATRHVEIGGPRRHIKVVASDVLLELEQEWQDDAARLSLCPGKELLSGMSRGLQEAGYKSVSARHLQDHFGMKR